MLKAFYHPVIDHIKRSYVSIGVKIYSPSLLRGEIDHRTTGNMQLQMPQLETLQIPKRSNVENVSTPEAVSAGTPKLPDDNARLQLAFDTVLKDLGGKGRPHKECTVLMISWDEKIDDLGTTEEVNKLGEVFEKQFKFKVVKKQIMDDHQSPQIQVHKILSDFVWSYNNPVSLLIIYYAGHGVPDERGLHLFG